MPEVIKNTKSYIDLYLKPLKNYLRMEDVIEVSMQEPKIVFLKRNDGKISEPIFNGKLTSKWFNDFTNSMSSITGEKNNCNMSFNIPIYGYRCQVVKDGFTENDFLLSIRIPNAEIFKIDDFDINEQDKEEIINAVRGKKTILISGGTGTGKTSFLNCLANNYIELYETLVVIEQVKEIILEDHHIVKKIFFKEYIKKGEDAIDAATAVNISLRLLPDRIIMGEIRKENSFPFLRAINTGHEGSIATIHANDPESAIQALKMNVIMNGDAVEGAINILDQEIRRNIFGVVQLQRIKDQKKIKGYFKKLTQ
jgi:type IV secretion system protein VirB11